MKLIILKSVKIPLIFYYLSVVCCVNATCFAATNNKSGMDPEYVRVSVETTHIPQNVSRSENVNKHSWVGMAWLYPEMLYNGIAALLVSPVVDSGVDPRVGSVLEAEMDSHNAPTDHKFTQTLIMISTASSMSSAVDPDQQSPRAALNSFELSCVDSPVGLPEETPFESPNQSPTDLQEYSSARGSPGLISPVLGSLDLGPLCQSLGRDVYGKSPPPYSPIESPSRSPTKSPILCSPIESQAAPVTCQTLVVYQGPIVFIKREPLHYGCFWVHPSMRVGMPCAIHRKFGKYW